MADPDLNSSPEAIKHMRAAVDAWLGDAGQPYTIGERGRELFVPDQSGWVYPMTRPSAGRRWRLQASVTVINNTGTPVSARVQQRPDGSLPHGRSVAGNLIRRLRARRPGQARMYRRNASKRGMFDPAA